MVDQRGEEVLLAYTYFISPSLILVLVKPRSEVMKAWYTLKSELFFIFLVSTVVIFFVVFKLTDLLVKRVEESDLKREMTYHKMEHTNKLASIGRLAAGIAHEINNPMAIINEKAGLMDDLIASIAEFPKKEKFTSLTGSIRDSVERCSTITHRLLGFARRMEVEIESIDINEIIREVYSFLEKEALYRNIEVELRLAEDLPEISSDHGQLQQVFLNILNNAFFAMEDGGIVEISSFEADQDTVCVSIKDNGVGMSEETKKHIFEPFFSTKKGYGTGLGLSITYGIVKKLGGNIEVQSKEGEGALFKVFLPKSAKMSPEV
jgi:two-component system NtrC family sensor kinase